MGYERERERDRDRGDRGDRGDRDRHSRYREGDRHHRRRSDSRSDEERRQRRSHSHYDYESRGRDERHQRSKSRSAERRNEEEWKEEETEHKIRLAIRNNTINFDRAIHEQYMSLPESKKQELAQQAQSPQHINECILVRQLYVSGMQDASDTTIRDFFSRYGEVEGVEIIKNFIFVKYFKVEDASNACADYHNINTTLHHNTHNSNFKIFFADHLKRFNVVSNNPQYQVKDFLIPVVYASVRNDPQYANQRYLTSLFEKYGFIRNMEIKRNELPTQRTYVLVEYETITQAVRAKEKMKVNRDRLGDRKSEITLLIDNEKITRKYPNINNQIRYQRKRQANSIQMGAGGGNNREQQQQHQVVQQQNQEFNSFNAGGGGNPQAPFGGQSKGEMGFEGLIGFLNEYGNREAEEEHQVADWSGFITRNKNFKVGVDFVRIHKFQPCDFEDIIMLNIAYRADLHESLDANYSLAGKFKASQSSHADMWRKEFIDYFSRKRRAGILMTNKYLIYLIPPLPELNIQYPIQSDELLALFFVLG